MSEQVRAVTLRVNGEEVHETVDVRQNLVDFLRERLGLTGSHVGCEHGVCGACTVRLDGLIVRGCLVLAVQCAGAEVETIEGVSDAGDIADLQQAFIARNALQCGYCTPGMLLTAQDLLRHCSAGVAAEPRRNPRISLRQLLPLHRLPGDRRRRRRGGASAGKTMSDDVPSALTALDRPNSYIGRAVPRPNLDRLTQGRGHYVSDVVLPRMVHVAFVRSPACPRPHPRHRRGRSESRAGRGRGRSPAPNSRR